MKYIHYVLLTFTFITTSPLGAMNQTEITMEDYNDDVTLVMQYCSSPQQLLGIIKKLHSKWNDNILVKDIVCQALYHNRKTLHQVADSSGTVLHIYLNEREKDLDVMKLILEIADNDVCDLLLVRDCIGMTVLHKACLNGFTVSSGNAGTSFTLLQKTPVACNSKEVAKLFLKFAGSKALDLIVTGTKNGNTALHLAVQYRPEVVEELFKAACNAVREDMKDYAQLRLLFATMNDGSTAWDLAKPTVQGMIFESVTHTVKTILIQPVEKKPGNTNKLWDVFIRDEEVIENQGL